jgi:hypothetical protein
VKAKEPRDRKPGRGDREEREQTGKKENNAAVFKINALAAQLAEKSLVYDLTEIDNRITGRDLV